ncbi:MAG: hypothetical protein D6800_02280 [Candidatus Zixiibacteriota bacterium]|nr:MAG: hypothetical protein D6800_02280 [candidate division Zixibacteria bacterium]
MKRILMISLIAATAFLVYACDDNSTVLVAPDPPPATPQGVFSITGDGVVWVVFNGIYEQDVNRYIIWRSLDSINGFKQIGSVDAIPNPNLDLLVYQFADSSAVNGVTYFYAVSAEDFAGQMSDLSAENVFDTPRPEGQVVLVANDIDSGKTAGFALSSQQIVDDQSPLADVYVDRLNGIMYMNAGNLDFIYGNIQDMGFTASFDDISWAPTDGWSELGFVELIQGHTYVVYTQTRNYAKFRVDAVNPSAGFVSMTWAFQTVVDNPELAPAQPAQPRRRQDKKTVLAETVSAVE